ncbi:hypothetical protein NDU88_003648 [Pleurodeles waltl]|uniref:Uncharacterized protein n=1 Tax=Pleurodeles waltl TaxID=8319 RepID=A0AAV7PDF6_PLEWA|nr:hypothetical protein NDU88_003648 [Pleurodeles waltl]
MAPRTAIQPVTGHPETGVPTEGPHPGDDILQPKLLRLTLHPMDRKGTVRRSQKEQRGVANYSAERGVGAASATEELPRTPSRGRDALKQGRGGKRDRE